MQKEKICPDEVFVCNMEGSVKDGPAPEKGLKQSQCTPLFMCAYKGFINDCNKDFETLG